MKDEDPYVAAMRLTPFGGFLRFQNFVAPKVIPVIFWILFAAEVAFGLFMLFSAKEDNYAEARTDFNTTKIVAGFVMLSIAPLVTRIACEIIVVIFKTYDACEFILRTSQETRSEIVQGRSAKS